MDAFKPRQKFATYGKASRSTLLGYSAVTKSFKEGPRDPSWIQEIQHEVNEDGLSQINSSLKSVKSKSGSGSEAPQRGSRLGRINGSRPTLFPALKDLERARLDQLYEVPSSDSEQAIASSRESGSSRKRRKVASTATKDTHDIVYDDASWQRHIAFEVSEHLRRDSESQTQACTATPSKKSQSTSHAPSSMNRGKISKFSAPPRVAERVQPLGRALHPDIVKPRLTGKQTKSTECLPAQKMGSRRSKQGDTSTPAGAAPEKPPAIRQRGSKSRNEALAYLQSEDPGLSEHPIGNHLMNYATSPKFAQDRSGMVQKYPQLDRKSSKSHERNRLDIDYGIGTQSFSPSRLNISALRIAPRMVPLPYWSAQHIQNSVTDSLLVPRPKVTRKRIVDQLKKSKVDPADSTESSGTDTPDNISSQTVDDEFRGTLQSYAGTEVTATSVNFQKLGSNWQDAVLHGSSQTGPFLQPGGSQVTYARQRSILTEEDAAEASLFNIPLAQDLDTGNRSRRRVALTNPPQLHQPASLSQVSEEAGEQNGPIKSVHELKEAGGNARQSREMEAMLDDIDNNGGGPVALQRSGLLTLAMKMQQPSFRDQLIDNGFESRLFLLVDSTRDQVVNILLAATLLLVVKGPISLQVLSQLKARRMLDFFSKHIGNDYDLLALAKDRVSNTSKAAQSDIKVLCDTFLGSSIWRAGRPPRLTTRVIALQYFEYLVRHAREVGSASLLLTQDTLEQLTEILAPHTSTLVPYSTPRMATDVQLAVSILESATLHSSTICHDRMALWSGASIERVIQLLPMVQSWSGESFGELRALVLRLCLNLTNNNPIFSEAFSKPEIIGASVGIVISHFQSLSTAEVEEEPALLLDNLILSLGLLINLAEWSDSARRLFVASLEHPTYLDGLIRLFLSGLKNTSEAFSEQELSSNVAFGYLSVLLSYLSINETIRRHIRTQLHGCTMKPLADAVEEFLAYHRMVANDICHVDDDLDIRASFIDRLQGVLDRLKQEEGLV